MVNKRDIFTGLIAINVVSIFVLLFTYVYFARDLSSKEGIMNSNDTGLILLDRQGNPFFSFYEAKSKTVIPFDKVPKDFQNAVIASEDKDFYYHPGFSVTAILRSFYLDVVKKDLAYGGSTITQQLVKNSLLSSQKSFMRKYQEIILAQEIERRYSKEDILEMYANSVYFGRGAFGLEQASQVYFGKAAPDLSLSQAAILAAVLPSPSILSPRDDDFSEAKKRRDIVLQKMLEQGYITREQQQAALSEKFEFKEGNGNFNSKAPHFALLVRDKLVEEYGEERVSRSGFKVKTSIDLDLQQYAENVVSEQVSNLARNRVSNGAAVVMDSRTGEVLAMVGSKDWYDEKDGKFNVATANRQPGSSFKPIVYAAALEKHLITPATVLKDEPITYKIPGSLDYKPKNYDGKFRGNVLVRRALANSLNVPAVEVINKVGVPAAVETANKMGISSLKNPDDYGISLVLGAGEIPLLEMTEAFSVFANQGKRNDPAFILEITDKFNKKVYQYQPNPKRVLSEEVAYQISSILSDKETRREMFGNALDTSIVAAVKTGTTENYKDSLTLGYTPSFTVGVWVGNNDGTTMDNIAGSLGAAPIWKKLIEKVQAGKNESFIPPDGLSALTVCKSNGGVIKEATSSGYLEYFIKGTEPTQPCFIPRPTTQPTTQPKIDTKPSETPKPEEKKEDKNR